MTAGSNFVMKGLLLRLLALVAVVAVLSLMPQGLPLQPVSHVWADDGDNGDDGDDGGGRSGYNSAGGRPSASGNAPPPRILRQLLRPLTGNLFDRRSRSLPRRSAPPPYLDRQIIAAGLSRDDLSVLQDNGYVVLEEVELALLDGPIVKLQVPDGVDLQAAREAVRALNAGARADFNHLYRPSSDAETDECRAPGCWARTLVAWPAPAAGSGSCTEADARIGMIDTGINADHEALAESRIEIMRIGKEESSHSGLQHGTAVASLFVGSPSSRSPGLVPAARLFAIDVFQRSGGGSDLAEAFDVVIGIDRLIGQEVTAINLSLAGEANEVLEQAIDTAADMHSVVLVAAAGNDGPAAGPRYPAAYPAVIAVTAIDRAKRIYRRAVRGPHIELAAPGVEIWAAASVRGARPKTGTSFAAPFVTAAAALLRSSAARYTPEEIRERLSSSATDLGEPGRDAIFGWGLIDVADACAGHLQPIPAAVE
jgi:subtilisin family serine protease